MFTESVKSELNITTESYEIPTIFLFFTGEIIDLYPRLTTVNQSIRSNDRFYVFLNSEIFFL
ncbi:MAG: hypothetical protein A3J84_10355 [Ignavibacteria bacterium RIFOXYA2_FULL_37_17]|nr:MAG: hypothetical protein A3J84_10355 [Ignavibacteria bacterium RIFOXYA2_FULL_37_17]